MISEFPLLFQSLPLHSSQVLHLRLSLVASGGQLLLKEGHSKCGGLEGQLEARQSGAVVHELQLCTLWGEAVSRTEVYSGCEGAWEVCESGSTMTALYSLFSAFLQYPPTHKGVVSFSLSCVPASPLAMTGTVYTAFLCSADLWGREETGR